MTLITRLTRFVGFDADTATFHCAADKAAFVDAQHYVEHWLAADRTKRSAVVKAKVDFAKLLLKGHCVVVEVKHHTAAKQGTVRSQDPERIVTQRCTHSDKVVKKDGRKFVRDAKGNKTYTLVRCTEMVTGPANKIGKVLCEKHQQ